MIYVIFWLVLVALGLEIVGLIVHVVMIWRLGRQVSGGRCRCLPAMGPPSPSGAVEAVETSMPRFGVPSLLSYRAQDYMVPLRCSILGCGGRGLIQGETFWAVPPPDDPYGDFVVVCLECVVLDAEVISRGV